MELTHRQGWRFFDVPGIGGADSCRRLCLDRRWVGDYQAEHLTVQLEAFGVLPTDFSPAVGDPCHVVDLSSRLTCPRRATLSTALAGDNFLLCARCRETMLHMRAAATPPVVPATGAVDHEDGHRLLATAVRQPIAKILGYAELLDDERDTLDPEHSRMVGVIHHAARELRQALIDRAS